MANPVKTNSFEGLIPKEIIEPWVKKVQTRSAIASLVPSSPVLFGTNEAFVFDSGEAEIVGEGDLKSSSDVTRTQYVTNSFTIQKTVRMSRQLEWADQSHRLQIINRILETLEPAMARGLDYAVFFGVNPATGASSVHVPNYIADGAHVIDPAGKASYQILDEAMTAVAGSGFTPQHLALSSGFGATFASQRDQDGRRLYPEFKFIEGENSTLEAYKTAISKTVSGEILTGDRAQYKGTQAFLGDFNALKWGVVNNLGLQRIEYGDPDGQGDLMRKNEIAFRVEMTYGFGIADDKAFARIAAPAAA